MCTPKADVAAIGVYVLLGQEQLFQFGFFLVMSSLDKKESNMSHCRFFFYTRFGGILLSYITKNNLEYACSYVEYS